MALMCRLRRGISPRVFRLEGWEQTLVDRDARDFEQKLAEVMAATKMAATKMAATKMAATKMADEAQVFDAMAEHIAANKGALDDPRADQPDDPRADQPDDHPDDEAFLREVEAFLRSTDDDKQDCKHQKREMPDGILTHTGPLPHKDTVNLDNAIKRRRRCAEAAEQRSVKDRMSMNMLCD